MGNAVIRCRREAEIVVLAIRMIRNMMMSFVVTMAVEKTTAYGRERIMAFVHVWNRRMGEEHEIKDQ